MAALMTRRCRRVDAGYKSGVLAAQAHGDERRDGRRPDPGVDQTHFFTTSALAKGFMEYP
jgi:hypothetical protein